MRRRRVSPAAAALLLAAAARCGGAADAPVAHKTSGSWGGQPVCDGGRWTEATAEELLTGKKEPNVQCAREPPCVRWSWVRVITAGAPQRPHRAPGAAARGRRAAQARSALRWRMLTWRLWGAPRR